jgi:hypothetical protein
VKLGNGALGPPDQQRQVIVRMPTDLHDAGAARAADEERSFAGLIRHIMRLYVNRQPPFDNQP